MMLNDCWAFVFHDPDDVNWTYNSYKTVTHISTVADFCHLNASIVDKVHLGMFFLMREHIFPCWDDPENINGGCFSLKVSKQHVKSTWEDLAMRLVGETLLKEEFKDLWIDINGISISPKKNFCIVKIWLKSADKIKEDMFTVSLGHSLFKLNKEVIDNNKQKTEYLSGLNSK